jgi:tetratricopeptide (TPR) repeat protein
MLGSTLIAHASANAQASRAIALQESLADSLYAAKQYAKAYSQYDSLTRRDSASAKYWSQLGMSAAMLSRYDKGAVAFERAAKLGPNPAFAYNAAAMHARLSHADSAFAWLNRAVQRGFSDGTLLQQDEDLASIRGDARFAGVIKGATTAPTPCMDAPENHKFDFWIGEWDVTTQGGARVGRSSIQQVSGGCALLENWTGNRGDTGKSLNAFNPSTNQWQQYYVGQGGGVAEFDSSEWVGASIVFKTTPGRAPAGGSAMGRLTFTPMANGVVRQHAERSTDEGKTWTTTYDFYYHRRSP